MVVRYSIGWRGRVGRGREVILFSFWAGTVANGLARFAGWGVEPESEIRRVRPGKAGLSLGGGAERRMERMVDIFYGDVLVFGFIFVFVLEGEVRILMRMQKWG